MNAWSPCSHNRSCCIRFDNQQITVVLTILSSWQMCFLGGHVELVIAEKLRNLLGVLEATTKGFVGVHQASQKPLWGQKAECVLIFSLSGSNVAALWPQGVVVGGIYCTKEFADARSAHSQNTWQVIWRTICMPSSIIGLLQPIW